MSEAIPQIYRAYFVADSGKNAVFKTWPFSWAFKYEVV